MESAIILHPIVSQFGMSIYSTRLTAAAPALIRERQGRALTSSETCAISHPLFLALQARREAVTDLQRGRTTQF
ncbi:UNVERIFIED_CONTAM: hypothetical protein FKN15_059952 [Acipenser sinensis]